MKPGKKLHVKVVDSTGSPIPEAYFQIKKWRGVQSLYNMKHSSVLNSGIPGRANSEGEYIWDWAPDDAIRFSIHHVENQKVLAQKFLDLTANDAEQVITLTPKFKLSGIVVDAITGNPVTNYIVVPISYYSELDGARGLAQANGLKEFSSSSFEMDSRFFSGDTKKNAFRFEAPGFRVFHSRTFSPEEAPQSLTVSLEPTETASGRILNINGEPARSARVAVVKPLDSLIISSFRDYARADEFHLKIDDKGIFHHATQTTPFAVVATTEEGYAEKYCSPKEPAGDLILQPWAKVEGVLFQDGKPVPDALVVLSPIRQLGGDNPHVQDNFQTRTDVAGRFAFEKTPPVPSTVSSILNSWRDYPITSSQILPLDLKPGETRFVRLGGDGLQVRGKVKLLGEAADKIEFQYGIHLLIRADGGAIGVPQHAQKEIEYVAGEQRDFDRKLAGPEQSLLGQEQHSIKLNPDGSYLINGVRPGSYRLLLKVFEPPTGCLVDPVGYGYLEFDTSDYPIADNQLDTGTVEIQLKPIPQVGDALANFSWLDAIDRPQSLSDFTGKIVLIDPDGRILIRTSSIEEFIHEAQKLRDQR